MRIATIRVRSDPKQALQEMRKQFLAAWKTGDYQGEAFEFESPAALFRLLTPKRWVSLETLQTEGPCGVRELARLLGRDVRRVHDDLSALLEAGLVEKMEEGKLIVPFGEIHADFVLRGQVA
jgi:predicted transcriptional regulator